MAEKKIETKTVEREYIIPLRKEWRKVANYRRTGRAIKFIKQFIARHMKVPERDISKVKLDAWLNQEIWFRGKRKPPAKIKVKAKKEGNLVKVELAELPDFVKFEKAKKERIHKAAAPKKEAKPTEATEEKKEEKSEEEKKEEKEKSTSNAEQKAILAKKDAKIQKQAAQFKETPIHRKALKK